VTLGSANLRLQGNGQGCCLPAGYLAELPSLVTEMNVARITVREPDATG
jgi:hypothetical protein